ncbi:MAG TPA: hypothetical protein VK921_02280 [Anditalea sp.]|nr:hypothetical protein [Anditalea sp.]
MISWSREAKRNCIENLTGGRRCLYKTETDPGLATRPGKTAFRKFLKPRANPSSYHMSMAFFDKLENLMNSLANINAIAAVELEGFQEEDD